METPLSITVADLQTPALVVYKHIVQENANRMIGLAKQFGVSLRPHFKTSKCIEAALMQTNGSKCGITVSTIAEADFLRVNGFDDVLYAVPLLSSKMKRCAELANSMSSFSILIDREDIISELEQYQLINGKQWLALVMIDCNNGRDGVPYDSESAIKIVEKLHSASNINFQGLYAHSGDAYKADNVDAVHAVASKTTNGILKLVKILKERGITCQHYGIGSTQTCSNPIPIMSKLTEWHPGNYIFYDVMQMRMGSCQQENIACFVLCRVVGHYPHNNSLLVDCGFTALSLHGGGNCGGRTPNSGYGVIVGHPELKLKSMTQELGTICLQNEQSLMDFSAYPIGMLLRILPDHSCATCAMHRTYHVADKNDVIIEHWKPVSGW